MITYIGIEQRGNKLFKLHSQLTKDTIFIGKFELSQLLIHKDANYPWFILVPMLPNISEIHQLLSDEAIQLIKESNVLSETISEIFAPDKINIAALGNMVPQLHLHHVARYKNDISWPNTIWGNKPSTEYNKKNLKFRIESLVLALSRKGYNII